MKFIRNLNNKISQNKGVDLIYFYQDIANRDLYWSVTLRVLK